MTNQDLLSSAKLAAEAAGTFARSARARVRALVAEQDKLSSRLLDKHQRAVHGYAWVETTAAALAATASWAQSLADEGSFDEAETDVLQIVFGEYLAQLVGGLPMSQNEMVRPKDLGVVDEAQALADNAAAAWFIAHGNSAESRARLAAALVDREYLAEPGDDETLAAVRSQFRRFVDQRILPHAHQWHLANDLIPDTLVAEMAELGTFGVCIDSEYGGLGLGKLAMCVVTEELSRGWLGVGSLGTRSEIAGELIGSSGTPEQKQRWLPGIASGEILPVAVFTEPGNGSDLGGLKTRAVQAEDGSWRVTGGKTWITHAARSDVMTLLVRTNPDTKGYEGLSMFIAPKQRGTDEQPFPSPGLEGGEIEVLGYRGMREYELGFSDFIVPEDALLGGATGGGFKQLMQTFEGARIQTAARAVGVAFRAYELARTYAVDRAQFGKPIAQFPRIADKLALMYAETIAARELTYFAAREKDLGHRCDIQAGMAKLIGARVAWVNADAAVQIHGGNGYALEYEISRVLCDARILNIFEGAAEIQAHVVARGKLA